MTHPDLDGEWLGFEEHLAQAIEEHLAEADGAPKPVPDQPPPDRTYERHLVLEDFECTPPR